MAKSNSFGLRANLWVLKLSRNWLKVALIIIGIYATLPFIAPTLMKIGATGPARVIYTLYSPFCHQFAFRTFFLYGEQPAYPLASTNSALTPYEEYITESPEFNAHLNRYHPADRPFDPYSFTPALQFASRDFLGNEQMGYKMTLCERDISIYLALFAGGLLYSIPVVRRKIRPVPLMLYIFVGIAPIGIDGVSQLFSYPPFEFWQSRETLPTFRVITGLAFGFMNAWLAFPYFEAAMDETRENIEAKLARAGILKP